MNLTQLRFFFKKYTPIIAVALVAVIAAVSFGTIWFLQRAREPIAPTAPTSRPSAANNVCSVEFVVRNECVGMKVMNAAGTTEITPDATGNFPVGSMSDFKLQCQGLQGTTKSSFQVYNEGNKEWNEFELKDHAKDETTKKFLPSTISTDAPPEGPNRRNNGDIVQVRCRPQAGEWTTGLTTVTANCTKKLIVTKTTTGGSCSDSCSADTDCTGGRVCSGGMCRNPSCPADADCTCGTTTGGSCSDSCSADTDCTGGRVCSGGMCRNASCPADADCSCDPTGVSCQVGAFNENFADATIDTKLVKSGPGTLTFNNGLGILEVIPTQAMGNDQRSSLESGNFISGNFQYSAETSQYTVGSGTGTVFARFALFAPNNVPAYRIDWRKGDNNSSELVVERTVPGNPVTFADTKTQTIATDSLVGFKAVRVGSVLDMYYQLNGGLNVKFATFNTSEILRPTFSLNSNATGRTTRAAIDNLALVCDTTVTNPPQSCSASCSTNNDCASGLSCLGGMCRNPSCSGETDCTCPTTTGASCNNTCSANADCADGLICNGGSCRNPSCVNQNNCQCTTTVASCNNTCTSNANCQSGLTCSGGVCRNPSCTNQSNCQCQIASGTSTPTPTPVASCSKSCVTSSDCSNGLTCSSGMCRNANCTADADCSCNLASGTPKPTPTTQLPQAGSTAQTLALVAIGVTIIGLGAARFRYMRK